MAGQQLLRNVLSLLPTTDRKLEPWICDIICDEVELHLNESDSNTDHVRGIISSPLHTNEALRLRLFNIFLRKREIELNADLVEQLEDHPAEVLDIFSTCLLRRGSTAPPAHLLYQLLAYLSQSSGSLNRAPRLAATRFLAALIVRGEEQVLETMEKELLMESLAFLYNEHDKELAARFAVSWFSDELFSASCQTLCQIRAHVTAKNEQLSFASMFSNLDFSSESLYWRTFFAFLVGILAGGSNSDDITPDSNGVMPDSNGVRHGSNGITCHSNGVTHDNSGVTPDSNGVTPDNSGALSYLLSQLVCLENTNVVVLAAILKSRRGILSQDVLRELFARADFLLPKTLDLVMNECGTLLSQRSGLVVLEELMELNMLREIVETSPGLLSSILSFLSDCSPDALACCSTVLCKVITILISETSAASLNLVLLRRLRHSDSRLRDIIVEFVGNLDLSWQVDEDVLRRIVEMSCSEEEDCYVKSSCFKALRRFPPGDTRTILGRIIRSVEQDDSMVAISFFSFLKNNYQMFDVDMGNVGEYVQNGNVTHASPVFEPDLKKYKSTPLEDSELDDVIHSICNASDCTDVQIIRRYDDKITSSNDNVTSHLSSDLLRLLSRDRCDVERMKASLDLVIEIVSRTAHRTRYLAALRASRYFDLVESYNGAFLSASIARFNEVLEGYYVIRTREQPVKQDLETVLGLLQSTPDPSIVMDCY